MIRRINIFIVFTVLFLSGSILKSQTPDIPIQVINSAGGGSVIGTGSSAIQIDYNVGEVAIMTIGSGTIITQGFLQPDFAASRFYIDSVHSDVSCFKKKDGKIGITCHNAATNSTIITVWNPNICPSQNCFSFDTLSPGAYTVTVFYYPGGGAPKDSVNAVFRINKNDNPCPLNIYNIVTPNGDGQNDVFFIENIEEYDGNVVWIYNRWGKQLSEIHNYNNQNNYWSGTVFDGNKNDDSKSENLPSGTYFYVIDLKDGSKVIKGFIELVRKN